MCQKGGEFQLSSQCISCKAIPTPLSLLLVPSSSSSSGPLVGEVWGQVLRPGLSCIALCPLQTGVSGMWNFPASCDTASCQHSAWAHIYSTNNTCSRPIHVILLSFIPALRDVLRATCWEPHPERWDVSSCSGTSIHPGVLLPRENSKRNYFSTIISECSDPFNWGIVLRGKEKYKGKKSKCSVATWVVT